MREQRHKWGEPSRFENERAENTKTERVCELCGLIKVTMHPPAGLPWREWWKDGQQIHCSTTPPCTYRVAEVEAVA